MTHGHLRGVIGGEYFGLRKKLDSGRNDSDDGDDDDDDDDDECDGALSGPGGFQGGGTVAGPFQAAQLN